MKDRFFVGQRVRIIADRTGESPYLVGTITIIDKPRAIRDFDDGDVLDCWGVRCGFYCLENEMEPPDDEAFARFMAYVTAPIEHIEELTT